MSKLGKRYRNGDNGFEDDGPPRRISRLACDRGMPGNLSSNESTMDLDLPESEGQKDLMMLNKICYGAVSSPPQFDNTSTDQTQLCEAQVLMGSITTDQTSPWTRFCSFPVEVTGNGCFLSTDDGPKTKQRPVLDCRTGSILCFVAEKIKDASFVAVVGVESLHTKRGKSKRKPSAVEVTVNAYGPRSLMDEVGKAMADVDVVLQHPVFLDSEIAYINPHFFYPQSQETDLSHLIGPAYKESKSAVSQAIDDALDSVNDSSVEVPFATCDKDDLRNVLGSLLVNTELKEYVCCLQRSPLPKNNNSPSLTRFFNSHQLHGVEFILGQESLYSVSETHTRLLSSIHYR